MTLAILTYFVLLTGFLIVSALILRHAVKYSYLSPRFRVVVSIFGIVALIIIIFSIYLLLSIKTPESGSNYDSGSSSSGDINF